MHKGEIFWVDFGESEDHEPSYRRPALVVQSDRFNQSRIGSVMVAPLTTNLALADAPGNVLLPASESGLGKDSVIVISQIVSINKMRLEECVQDIPPAQLFLVDKGIQVLFDIEH